MNRFRFWKTFLAAGAFCSLFLDVFAEESEAESMVQERPTVVSSVTGDMSDWFSGFLSGTIDYVSWQLYGSRKMQEQLDRARQLYQRVAAIAKNPEEGECSCNHDNLVRVRDMLGRDMIRWQQAYGMVNGWAAVAHSLKLVGDGAGVAFDVIASKTFGDKIGSIASDILGRVKDFQEARLEFGDWKTALITSQLGDPVALAEDLKKLAAKNWDDCTTMEEKVEYIETVLAVRSEIGKLGKTGGAIVDSEMLKVLDGVMEATDSVAQYAQIALDAWHAYDEASKYFPNVSAAMSTLAIMSGALTAYERIIDESQANAGGCSCAPGCACGCPCANCNPPEEEEPPEEGNPRPPSGGGSSQGGGAGDNYISAWIREARVGDAEDPWKPIHDGIVTEGAVSSGSKTLSDVIGYGEFSKILDAADELAKWNDAAGSYKDFAAGIWGAVTSGGSGAGTAIEKVLDQVIQWGNSWLDRFLERQSAKIGDWLMEKVGGIVEKLEALVEPWNRAMEKANASIRNWVAVSVEKWLETMKEYSDVMKEESRTDPLRGWMTVDYGYDGSVDVDAGAVPRTGNRRKNRYMETMGR